jgi:hypothetical protein
LKLRRLAGFTILSWQARRKPQSFGGTDGKIRRERRCFTRGSTNPSRLNQHGNICTNFRNKLIDEQFSPSAKKLQASALDREFLLVFSLAVAEKRRADESQSQARQALRRLISRLELSSEDLGGLLSVSADIVNQ